MSCSTTAGGASDVCSVCGLVVLGGSRPQPGALAAECHRLLIGGRERGADSFGLVVMTRDGTLHEWKGMSPPALPDVERLLDPNVSAVIANCRAVPTTEWAVDAGPETAQPFRGVRWAVTHNGTIANDRELAGALGVRPPVPVDSAILPLAFDRWGFEEGLARVRGSFALAAVDRAEPRTLRLARNYKPLCVARHPTLDALCFASTERQLLGELPAGELALERPRAESVPPYHRLTVLADSGRTVLGPLEAEPPGLPRTLVVASGGLDSTVAAALLRRRGYEVTLLHFLYRCRAQPAELRAVRAAAEALCCPVRVVPLDWLGRLGGSTLTVEGAGIASGEAGAEFPHEWVPARNMLMIACACALADAEGFTHVALGTNLEEGGAYPDNTQEFVGAMDAASQLGTMTRTRVTAPLGNLVKHQIVRLGLEIDAPLHLTWSCYHDGDRHCGDCGPCYMRRTAFRMNCVPDPIPYARPGPG
jgi:7-cyano-7-deazaguanine synthase